MFLFIADKFGYGPISTLLSIASRIKEKSDKKLVFIGPKFCIDYINNEVFDECIVCEDYKCYKENEQLFLEAEKIIVTETTDILIELINEYHLDNLYLIDNLFWMWDFLESELKYLKRYYVSNAIDVSKNLDRIGKEFSNIKIVGNLRDLSSFKECSSNNNLLITFGGAESYMYDSNYIYDYYLKVVRYISKLKVIAKYDHIYITGGRSIINHIIKNCYLNEKFIVKSLSKKEFSEVLYKSKDVIASPGLGHFNELICSDIRTLFLHPINYSQYLQSLEYKKIGLDFDFLFFKGKPIENYLEESIGVNKVIKKFKNYNFNSDYDSMEKIIDFLNRNNHSTSKRKKYYDSIDKDGINEVVGDILGECYE